ncbi:hypothetical protein [Methylorubrum sp. SB2]|uniref:hypothetical protein n=1 Tax=Methylorubrum subtropicum TaxID=3138812 RepID=UPI00313B7B22
MHRVKSAADDRDRILDRDERGELDVARHLADPAGRADDGVLKSQKVFLGGKAGKIGDPLKRCFQSVTQDKCSHALLKKRPLILLHLGKCPPIRRESSCHSPRRCTVPFSPHRKKRVGRTEPFSSLAQASRRVADAAKVVAVAVGPWS